MWTTVYISQKPEEAQNIRLRLEDAGICVKSKRTINAESGESCYELLVPSRELQEAHNLIIDAEL